MLRKRYGTLILNETKIEKRNMCIGRYLREQAKERLEVTLLVGEHLGPTFVRCHSRTHLFRDIPTTCTNT